jgi:ribosomal protein S13
MKLYKKIDDNTICKRMLINAIKIEESLSELLIAEAKILRKMSVKDISYEELQSINRTIKHIIFSLTLVDEKVQKGLELYQMQKDESK